MVTKFVHDDSTPERGTYSKSIQSLLLCVSMSVGLGNIWRFPNLAYNNGGAAFLIPYLLLLIIIGRPLYYMEMILGQFSSQGPIKVWNCVPAFKGIGYGQIISLSMAIIFYNYLMALSLFYMFASMQSCLPWSSCHYDNITQNGTFISLKNMTMSQHFWKYEVLEEIDGVHEVKSISWKLLLCLLLTWVVVYLAVSNGVQSLGKVSYFTAFFPYIVLVSLLIVACMEEGAVEGIKYFFWPKLEHLLDMKVWYKACEQSFFSLAIGYGNIIMISSYNKFNNNIYRDAIIISVLDTVTSILAGAVVFAVLGTLSVKHGLPVSKVVNQEGLGLAFIAYPEAVEGLKYVPQLWSVLFFFMLFILGVGSSMSMIESVLTVIKDEFPRLRDKTRILSLSVCLLFFCLGLPLVTNVGQLVLLLLNNFGVGAAAFVYGILEVMGVMWVYGLTNFCRDASFMLNRPMGIFWKVTWAFTAPVALTVIFVYGIVNQSVLPTDDNVPPWSTAVGWLLAVVAIIQIPIWFVIVVYNSKHTNIIKKLQSAFRPTSQWGPSDPQIRIHWNEIKKLSLKKAEEKSKSTKEKSKSSKAYVNETYQEDVI